jgi:copper chaperone CopZ
LALVGRARGREHGLMRAPRLAILLVAVGLLVVGGYLLSAGRAGRAERRAEQAAFAIAHPGADGTLVMIDVDGMSCPDCAKSVHEELSKVHGVVACRVDLVRHVAEVRLSSKDVAPQALLAAVSDAGYDGRIEP